MKRVGIVGASGYSGYVLLKLLLNHPLVRVNYVGANTTTGKINEIWPQLNKKTNLVCEKFNAEKAAKVCDLVFLAVPHKVSMEMAPSLLKLGVSVIDLSGDYRLDDPKLYKKWYGVAHQDLKNLKKAVYGLPEIFRNRIKKANFITNPGCYPTAALLALAPLVSIFTNDVESIVIDAKSGVSGAGRKADLGLISGEVNENFKAYKVLKHQHTPEIKLYLEKISDLKNMDLNFVAHLLPINQGIQETIYVRLKNKISLKELHKIYDRFYKTETFVRVLPLGVQPEIKNVAYSNYCDLGMEMSEDGRLLVLTSTIDNLYKGAAGQAIQNMNLLCGFEETLGLI